MRCAFCATVTGALIGGGFLASTTASMAGLTDYYDVITLYAGEDGYGGGGTDVEYYGTSGGVGGWAIGTTACNLGDVPAPWEGGTNNVPVIAQQVYRYKAGRFELIGISWLKHSFCAVSEPGCEDMVPGQSCQSTSCDTLGVGCGDTYWADLNSDADAPRSEINATTGEYPYPFNLAPSGPSSIRGRLQIHPDDINPSLNASAQYFIEGQYVEPGESVFGTQLNNASSRAVRFTSTTNCTGLSDTIDQLPAVKRWETLDANATVDDVYTDETGQGGEGMVNGLLHVGHSATDNGGGTWHYEFLMHNQNSYRSVGVFSVPVPDCVEVSNVEYRGPVYHSGETVTNDPWTWEHSGGMLTFSTDAHTADNNDTAPAIRWATMANFRFDADAAPVDGDLSLELWRSGPGQGTYYVAAGVPDCDEDPCPEDLNGDGVINVDDILGVIAGYGAPEGDVNGDGIGDVNDILMVLAAFGTSC